MSDWKQNTLIRPDFKAAAVGSQDMGVNNASFLVDRLSVDCEPLQLLRELTQNSIDAIEKIAPDNPNGRIKWGYKKVNKNIHKLKGQNSLQKSESPLIIIKLVESPHTPFHSLTSASQPHSQPSYAYNETTYGNPYAH